MLKVLVTSGGTKVKIDDVRSITNMSRGTFGCKIATEFLKADKDIQLIFLRAEESCSPFLSKYYAFDGIFKNFISLYKNQKFYKKNKKRVIEIAYKTYEDYARTLNRLLDSHKPDITVLAAAVSDYIIPNPVSGKVRSSEDLKIELVPAEKLIGKAWRNKNILVGFKLLVDSTDEELIAAAKKSIKDNKCSMVVANDLRDIRNNDHKVIIVTRDTPLDEKINVYYSKEFGISHSNNYLASMVVRHSLNEWNNKYVVCQADRIGKNYGK